MAYTVTAITKPVGASDTALALDVAGTITNFAGTATQGRVAVGAGYGIKTTGPSDAAMTAATTPTATAPNGSAIWFAVRLQVEAHPDGGNAYVIGGWRTSPDWYSGLALRVSSGTWRFCRNGGDQEVVGPAVSVGAIVTFVCRMEQGSANKTMKFWWPGGGAGTITFASTQVDSHATAFLLHNPSRVEPAFTDMAFGTGSISDAEAESIVSNFDAALRPSGNAAPVVVTTGSTLAYSEGNGAVVIDSGLTVTDADNANLTGATIQITSGGQAGADVLSFTNQLGITGTWTAGTFTLALSGTTTVENYQTALRAVRYQNTSQAPTFADRIVTFTANDGTATGSGTRSIQVYTDNDAPVVNVQAGNMTYATGSGAVAIAPTLTVTDVDSANLTSAYVQITSGYASSEDLLAFTNQLGITGSWDSVTGSITLTGTTTVENYQTALRSITYQNSNASPGSLARSVNFRVTDPSNVNGSDTKNIDITITAVPTFTFDTTDILRNLSNEAQPNLTGVPYRVYSVSTGTLVASGTTTTTGTGRLANMTPSGIVTGTTYLLIFGDLATGPLGWMRKAAS